MTSHPTGGRRRRWLGLLLVAFPVVELVILVWLGQLIGWGWLAMILAGQAVVAGLVMRSRSARFRRRLAAAEPARSTGELADGAVVFAGAVLLAFPGVLSDLAALLCLVPAGRGLVRRWTAGVASSRLGFNVGLLHNLAAPQDVIRGETVENAAYPSAPTQETVVIRGQISPD